MQTEINIGKKCKNNIKKGKIESDDDIDDFEESIPKKN